MKTFSKVILIAMLVLAIALPFAFAGGLATQPPSGAPGIEMESGVISTITTTTAGIYKITAPWPLRVLGFSVVANDITGAVTFDLTNGTSSLLTSAATGSTVVSQATLTTLSTRVNIAAGGTLQINTAGTGTANNVTYQINLKRN